MVERIDAHHHLWRYSREEYGWIGPGMDAIARDFRAGDLEKEIRACEIGGTIVVQAQQTVAETDWLLSVAENSFVIRGVVGWAPLCGDELGAVLEKWSSRKKLKGLRHVIQDEPDDEFILREDFNRGVRALRNTGLVYEILIYERHLRAAIAFVDRHPDQLFVLDHVAKPRIKERVLEPWRANIRELAKRDNVYCKLSGMVTEADWTRWTVHDLRPYVEVALDAFGAKRLMFGSDWPVCLVACGYQKWFDTAREFTSELSDNEKELIFGGVAAKAYSLEEAAGATVSQNQG